MPPYPNLKDYRIEEYIGPVALESIRVLWEQWQDHPNADIDFFSTVVNSRSNVVNPVALIVYCNDKPVAMAAGRLEKVSLPISFGYLKITHSSILQLTIIYGGLMGMWDDSGASVFICYLKHLMRLKRIDAVYLAAMKPDSPVYAAANRLVPCFLRDSVVKNNLHWSTGLHDTFDAFQKKINAKHRSHLRNKEHKLAEHLGGAIQMKIFKAPEEVALFCLTAEKIAQATYLRGLGEGFYDNEEMRNRLNLAGRKGWMRGYVLYVNEKPCTFWLGTLYQHLFYLDYTGFYSDLRDFNVGQLLFIKMVEALFDEGAIRGVDFGFGDAIYKQQYGDRSWKESDVYLFNNTPGMLLVNILRKSAALVRLVAEITLQRFELLNRVKRRWRLSAQKSVGNPANVETVEKQIN